MKTVTVTSNCDKCVCSPKLPGLWKCCILVREECVCGDFGVCGVGGVCEQCVVQVGMVEPGEEPPGERSSSHSLWKHRTTRSTAPVGRTSSEPEHITGQEQEVTRRRPPGLRRRGGSHLRRGRGRAGARRQGPLREQTRSPSSSSSFKPYLATRWQCRHRLYINR